MSETQHQPKFTLGDYMRKARESAHLSSEVMAAELGVSRQTVTNYERGHTEPTKSRLRLWARVTGVDPEWLERGRSVRTRGLAEEFSRSVMVAA